MERRSAVLTRCVPSLMPVLACLLVAAMPAVAFAQSDAGAVQATVTVLNEELAVTGLFDLEFGSHFASEGVVLNSEPAVWDVSTGSSAALVDLTMSQLPSFLDNGSGDLVPVTYGVNSLAALCSGGSLIQADPSVGIQSCLIESLEGGNVVLGNTFGNFPGTELVEVDLSSAVGGTYTATLELTATLN